MPPHGSVHYTPTECVVSGTYTPHLIHGCRLVNPRQLQNSNHSSTCIGSFFARHPLAVCTPHCRNPPHHCLRDGRKAPHHRATRRLRRRTGGRKRRPGLLERGGVAGEGRTCAAAGKGRWARRTRLNLRKGKLERGKRRRGREGWNWARGERGDGELAKGQLTWDGGRARKDDQEGSTDDDAYSQVRVPIRTYGGSVRMVGSIAGSFVLGVGWAVALSLSHALSNPASRPRLAPAPKVPRALPPAAASPRALVLERQHQDVPLRDGLRVERNG